jgi:hypothetical protein
VQSRFDYLDGAGELAADLIQRSHSLRHPRVM